MQKYEVLRYLRMILIFVLDDSDICVGSKVIKITFDDLFTELQILFLLTGYSLSRPLFSILLVSQTSSGFDSSNKQISQVVFKLLTELIESLET